MTEVKRSMLGRFGIAVKYAGREYLAWAADGPTESDSPVREPSVFIVFSFGKTEREAIEGVKAELCNMGVAEPEAAGSFIFTPPTTEWHLAPNTVCKTCYLVTGALIGCLLTLWLR